MKGTARGRRDLSWGHTGFPSRGRGFRAASPGGDPRRAGSGRADPGPSRRESGPGSPSPRRSEAAALCERPHFHEAAGPPGTGRQGSSPPSSSSCLPSADQPCLRASRATRVCAVPTCSPDLAPPDPGAVTLALRGGNSGSEQPCLPRPPGPTGWVSGHRVAEGALHGDPELWGRPCRAHARSGEEVEGSRPGGWMDQRAGFSGLSVKPCFSTAETRFQMEPSSEPCSAGQSGCALLGAAGTWGAARGPRATASSSGGLSGCEPRDSAEPRAAPRLVFLTERPVFLVTAVPVWRAHCPRAHHFVSRRGSRGQEGSSSAPRSFRLGARLQHPGPLHAGHCLQWA